MRIAVVGYKVGPLHAALTKAGFTLTATAIPGTRGPSTTRKPSLVISYGGDGTSLYAERIYPGIPRILVRHSRTCKLCKVHDYTTLIRILKNKQYTIKEYLKLEASIIRASGQPRRQVKRADTAGLIALNEIAIHHKPPHALRFTTSVSGTKTIIGDGVIVSTPHGSTGYYQAITRNIFRKGIGIAFSNPVEPVSSKVIRESGIVSITIVRGPGWVFADNMPKPVTVQEDDIVLVKKHDKKAHILEPHGCTVRKHFVHLPALEQLRSKG